VSALAVVASMPEDPELELLVPQGDVAEPELSIVIPALNERLTIGDFVDWCKEGLQQAGVRGEILIVDSSNDDTAQIALAHGARVLKAPRRGLGRAYQDALPFVRGRWVMMGDCDCTYDFRELKPFVEKFHEGFEFVMGSRFKGVIDPGSMPPLHRYFGTPGTTWILNVIFGSRFSDIHCGMRGMTLDALKRMHLRSQSWEYASEMVLKSVHMHLRTTEVPIHFLKDRDGRLSHHKRSGWLSPWKAAWINLRAMFVYGADFFLFKPGMVLLALGLLLTLPLSLGPVTVGPIHFSLYWMLLGLSLSIVGLQAVYLGVLAQVYFDYHGDVTRRWFRVFAYNRTALSSGVLFVVGLGLGSLLVREYVRRGYSLAGDLTPVNSLAVTGLMLMIFGFMTFTFTLLLHATALVVNERKSEAH
jgi:glycosyltransferase involved in cell wall biosynthesis